MYLIKHYYDVDGGFGDAVGIEEAIGFVSTEEEAKEYCKQWSHPCVYAKPYASLHCGKLGYEKINSVPKDPWEGSQWKYAFEGKPIDDY